MDSYFITEETQKQGDPAIWVPHGKDSSLLHGARAKSLRDRPLSSMGYALSIAAAGSKYRAKKEYQQYISRVFGTLDHPFQPLHHRDLEQACRIAYNTVRAFLLGFCLYWLFLIDRFPSTQR